MINLLKKNIFRVRLLKTQKGQQLEDLKQTRQDKVKLTETAALLSNKYERQQENQAKLIER